MVDDAQQATRSNTLDSNRRRFPRLSDPPVEGKMTVRAEARLTDISLYGVGLEGEDAMEPNRSFRMTIHGGDRPVILTGKGVWNHLTSKTNPQGAPCQVYRGGFKLDKEPNPATTSDLELSRFIALNAVGHRGSGERKRYKLKGTIGPVDLEAHYTFRVKSISASGMLIETDLIHDPKSRLQISVRLPWVLLQLNARLIRSDRIWDNRTKRPRSVLAVEFEDLDDQQRRQLQGLVAEGQGDGFATPLT